MAECVGYSTQFVCVKSLSRVRLFEILWTIARQAPPSMGFPRQEYWSGLPFPSSGDLPDPGMEPVSPALQADSLPLSYWGSLSSRQINPECEFKFLKGSR